MQRQEQFMMIYTALLSNSNLAGRSPDLVIYDARDHLRAIIEFEKQVEADPQLRMLLFGIDATSLEQAVAAREQHTVGENPATDGTGVA